MKKIAGLVLVIGIAVLGYVFIVQSRKNLLNVGVSTSGPILSVTSIPKDIAPSNPLAIETMRQKSYPGSDLTIKSTLSPGSNYNRYLASYQSEGLTQYGLLTVPVGEKPEGGWPVILFNHGYIPPGEYSTENSYASFISPFAQAGYIVFKPDYRGNGNSEGVSVQIYVSSDYLTDSMNALASIRKYKDANPQKIGVMGHSMGGNITLHEVVISPDIKAAEIMSGVVGDEAGILNWWDQRITARSITGNDLDTSYIVQKMIIDYGTPANNPDYWNAIDPTKYLANIAAPVQIQVGTSDTAVPPSFSSSLRDQLQGAGKTVDYREYRGADHNLAPDTSTALSEALAFFNTYLK